MTTVTAVFTSVVVAFVLASAVVLTAVVGCVQMLAKALDIERKVHRKGSSKSNSVIYLMVIVIYIDLI